LDNYSGSRDVTKRHSCLAKIPSAELPAKYVERQSAFIVKQNGRVNNSVNLIVILND